MTKKDQTHPPRGGPGGSEGGLVKDQVLSRFFCYLPLTGQAVFSNFQKWGYRPLLYSLLSIADLLLGRKTHFCRVSSPVVGAGLSFAVAGLKVGVFIFFVKVRVKKRKTKKNSFVCVMFVFCSFRFFSDNDHCTTYGRKKCYFSHGCLYVCRLRDVITLKTSVFF